MTTQTQNERYDAKTIWLRLVSCKKTSLTVETFYTSGNNFCHQSWGKLYLPSQLSSLLDPSRLVQAGPVQPSPVHRSVVQFNPVLSGWELNRWYVTAGMSWHQRIQREEAQRDVWERKGGKICRQKQNYGEKEKERVGHMGGQRSEVIVWIMADKELERETEEEIGSLSEVAGEVGGVRRVGVTEGLVLVSGPTACVLNSGEYQLFCTDKSLLQNSRNSQNKIHLFISLSLSPFHIQYTFTLNHCTFYVCVLKVNSAYTFLGPLYLL